METAGHSMIQVKRRIVVGLFVVPLFLGLPAFANILGDPRFHDIRSLDVVGLIAVGACWGVAVVGFALLMGSKFRKG